MAALTLGLDLGPNSIGWALVDEGGKRIVAAGVRVFPEGVDRDTSGAEVSKTQGRRIARAMRRQIARRAGRKHALRKALVRAGLLPQCALLPRGAAERDAWERDAFRHADPITLRARALSECLEPFDLGRALLHLGQRRGFKSNRKTDRANRKESSELLQEISALAAEIGDRTLGQYLADQRGSDPARFHEVRLRGRHTRRDMYEHEFARIWDAQRAHHPRLLTESVRAELHDILFFQRDLRPPSPGLIGRCEVLSRLPRCPRADRRAQRFRLFQEVNNLRVIDAAARLERPLSADERTQLLALLRTRKELAFDKIRAALFAVPDAIRFNLERGGRSNLKGMPTDALLAGKGLIGKAWWGVSEELKDRIVAALIDDDEPRVRFLLSQAGLPSDLAATLLDKVSFEDGYASYSLHVIKRLLPHLEQGLPLTSKDATAPSALRAAGFQAAWERVPAQARFLPAPPAVTNPLVRAALHEVRKVVNAILRELVYRDGHTLERIQVELAREVRGTAKQRREQALEMRDRQRAREAAAEKIRELGHKPTREAIERYRLWQEQGGRCVYSGRAISLSMLFGGEVDFDHILPYSRSLDDALMNRVVALRTENSQKGDQTPYEWLAARDPAKYEQVLQRARELPYPKQKRFLQERVELDDFFARQFVDTTYITTQVHEYVRCLGADVVCPKGQHTAELRWQWGLDTILEELADGPAWCAPSDLRPGEKNRADHRHHAIDAIVIALTGRSRLQQLAALRRAGGTERTGAVLPEPWPDFRRSVREVVAGINVSHRVRRRISGALHEETVYGPTAQAGEFVYRKPVESLTPAMLDDIRDDAIRRLVREHVAKQVDLETAKKIPLEVWRDPPRMPSGVPIRRVRIVRRDETIQPIRGRTAWIKPGSVHHVCLFELPGLTGPIRDAVFVSRLEAMRRVRAHQPVIERQHPTQPGARFLLSIAGNELLLIEHDGKTELYRFETGASTSKQMWFRHHSVAGKSSDKRGRISKMPGTLHCTKVTVDPLGRIRRARD